MRLFVAVWPDEFVLDQLAGLDRPVIEGVRWATRDQWHVTMRFFGEVEDPSPVEAALRVAASGVRSVVATAGPQVKRVGNMLWAPVEGLESLARVVVDATASFGAPPEDRRFRGHITLARQRSRGRSSVLRGVAGASLAGSWDVRSIDLVRSHPGRGGSRYETIAQIPLG
jgi:2'-5' RNA ligase